MQTYSSHRPNPSIERTSSSKLRLLPAAAHVKRWAATSWRHLRLVPGEVVLLGKAGCWLGYGRVRIRPTTGATDATAAAFWA
jgi:hypothetical protein